MPESTSTTGCVGTVMVGPLPGAGGTGIPGVLPEPGEGICGYCTPGYVVCPPGWFGKGTGSYVEPVPPSIEPALPEPEFPEPALPEPAPPFRMFCLTCSVAFSMFRRCAGSLSSYES